MKEQVTSACSVCTLTRHTASLPLYVRRDETKDKLVGLGKMAILPRNYGPVTKTMIKKTMKTEMFPEKTTKKHVILTVCGSGDEISVQLSVTVLRNSPDNHLVFDIFLMSQSFVNSCQYF